MARIGGAPLPTITSDSALGGMVIERSLRFNDADTAYLERNVTSSSNRKTHTFSAWIKRCEFGDYHLIYTQGDNSGNEQFYMYFNNSDQIEMQQYDYPTNQGRLITTQKFRDPSAWYHIVMRVDTTNSTADDRFRIYVNGEQVTSFGTRTNPSQNLDTWINDTTFNFRIGATGFDGMKMNGYMTEINFIDGLSLDPSSFGYTEFQTGIWRPKRYEGTYGTNGFYLDFSDNSSTTTLGIDKSPKGNDFTLNNFSVSAGIDNDSFTDTPTLKNEFAQLNSNLPTNSGASYRNGNYTFYLSHDGNHHRASSNMPVNSGKWYAEFKLTTYSFQSGSYPYIGVCAEDRWINSWAGDAGTAYQTGGTIWRNGSSIESGHATYTQGDIISVAINLDSSPPQVWWAKNGTYIRDASANPATGAYGVNIEPASETGYYNFAMSLWASTGQWDANFGQRAFSYDIPAGFKTLCTDNIRSTQSIIPKKHFDVLTYTGDGSSSNEVTGLEFKPDLVWFKCRSTTHNHDIYDSVRGANKRLIPNSTSSEDSYSNLVQSFNKDGVTLGTAQEMNQNSATYVAWCWKAGGAAVTNTDGSVDSQVSANPAAGFSIVTYSGSGNRTIGHGLNRAPEMIIMKGRNVTDQWTVGHSLLNGGSNAWNYGTPLNSTTNIQTNSTFWNNTAPTDTVFSRGSWNAGYNMVYYCFHSVEGFARFSSYVGNGNADGPFVHCGFRPAFVLTKMVDTMGENWTISDSSRSTFNPVNLFLRPDETTSDTSGAATMDFLSNGFKLRNTDDKTNRNGATFIFMAFAERTALTAFDQANPNAR